MDALKEFRVNDDKCLAFFNVGSWIEINAPAIDELVGEKQTGG
jgi:hypothetical protein